MQFNVIDWCLFTFTSNVIMSLSPVQDGYKCHMDVPVQDGDKCHLDFPVQDGDKCHMDVPVQDGDKCYI